MITQDLAKNAINNLGLSALGLASAQLTTRWSTGDVTFDAATLRLTTTGVWRAMASGTLHWRPLGAPELRGVDGAGLAGALAVLRLHPQTHLRLVRLYAQRFEGDANGRSLRPVPYAVAFHGVTMPADLRDNVRESDAPAKPDHARVGAELRDADWRLEGALSFHDERGLVLDPVAVAVAFRELMLGFTALRLAGDSASDLDDGAGAGLLGAIRRLASGRRVHFVDLHGGSVVPANAVRIGDAAVTDAGPHDWPEGQVIQLADAGGPARLGFATHGEVGAAALSPPSLPATPLPAGSAAPTLSRDFFRVVVVDLVRHLTGNRTDATLESIPGADAHTRAEEPPQVRDSETAQLLVDGQSTLGAMQEARASHPVAFVVSPVVATDFDLPADAAQRWPAAPALPAGVTAAAWDPAHAARVRTDWTAKFIGAGLDVELTLPAGVAPRGAAVRVFSRDFVEGPALADAASAERGDGGATIVGDGDVRIFLRDPLRVGNGPQPSNARLRFDVIVVPRPAGQPARARLFGGLVIPIGAGGTAPDTPTPQRALAGVAADHRAECHAPVHGLTPPAPASGALERVLLPAPDTSPREAPRYPTMARNDSVLAARDSNSPITWDAVLTNGWIDRRSLRAAARLGNPGNPAGPEERVVGARVGGRLAQDLARACLRRTRGLAARLPDLDDPAFATTAAGAGTIAGAVLQTIAPVCDNPELSALSDPASLPADWTGVRNQITPYVPAVANLSPQAAATDRWIAEVKREAMTAKYGRRDAQWALRWQIGHARTLIYIESMLFGATAEAGGGDHTWDLVAALDARLRVEKGLHLILSLPRVPPFGPGYEGWARRFHDLRNAAIDRLVGAAQRRVLVFHPVGFPGRPEVVRGNVVIVDDVWALLGSSTLARRGLTFDGGLDLSLFDRRLTGGASAQLRDLRRSLMAQTLGKSAPAAGDTPDPGWVRLASMTGAFAQFREVLEDHGGEGLIQPLYRGPTDVLPQSQAIADPDGRAFGADLVLGTALAGALASLGGARV